MIGNNPYHIELTIKLFLLLSRIGLSNIKTNHTIDIKAQQIFSAAGVFDSRSESYKKVTARQQLM